MKKTILLVSLLAFVSLVQGQILKKITDRAKQKAEAKANEKVDTKVDKTVDSAFSKTEKAINEAVKGNPKENQSDTLNSDNKNEKTSAPPASIKAYSKYDFVPGEKVIGFEDFSTGTVGDFPAGWNTTASAEIVTIEGKTGRWLWLTKPGVFVPEFTEQYPEDFTFEFDLLHGVPIRGAYFNLTLAQLTNI